MAEIKTFIALITFERTAPESEYLPPDAHGAVGWMAGSATDEDDLRDALFVELGDVGLRLLAVEKIHEIDVDCLPDGIDVHLAGNMRNWEPGKRTVWGTIHVYRADGEA